MNQDGICIHAPDFMNLYNQKLTEKVKSWFNQYIHHQIKNITIEK